MNRIVIIFLITYMIIYGLGNSNVSCETAIGNCYLGNNNYNLQNIRELDEFVNLWNYYKGNTVFEFPKPKSLADELGKLHLTRKGIDISA